jgi:hypothetical protein
MAGLVPAIHVLGGVKDVDATGERSDAVLQTAMHKAGMTTEL